MVVDLNRGSERVLAESTGSKREVAWAEPFYNPLRL
jgi:hypothetical protein